MELEFEYSTNPRIQALTDTMKMDVHRFMDMCALSTHHELVADPGTVADCYFLDKDQIRDYGYPWSKDHGYSWIKYRGLTLVLNPEQHLLYVAQLDADTDIINCGVFWVLDPESVEYLMMQDQTE